MMSSVLKKGFFVLSSVLILLGPGLAFAQATSSDALVPSSTFAVPLDASSSAAVLEAASQENGGTDAGTDVEVTQAIRDGVYEQAVVESVRVTGQKTDTTGRQVDVYQIRFTSGVLEGKTHEVVNEVGSNPYGLRLRTGDKVVVLLQITGDEVHVFIEGYDRRNALYGLVVLFFVVMLLLAGWQGVKVAFSICISVAIIGWVLIPAFMRGFNPVPIAIVLSGALTFISTGLSTGWNKKSLVTAIGTIGGTLAAFLVAWVFADWANLNGLATEEDRLFFDKNPLLNPRGLLFAGIIIASGGVVEDVAVSIASGVSEVGRANRELGFKSLFRSGMVIGNDHMAALANTLVFAYVGSSMSSLLLYSQFGGSWLKFVNFDSVVDEVIRSLAGTIGLVFTVPITAFLIAWLVAREHKNHG